MSYPTIDAPNFMENLLKRKEFYSLKIDPGYNFRDPAEGVNLGPLADRYLKLHSHQLFVKNFMSPNTPFKRLHLLHGTGCHPAGTKILTSNGRLVCVENILPGDKLLGDNRDIRRVTKLLRGYDAMYRINLESGDSFDCNHDHLLTLKFGDICADVPLGIFITMPEYVKKFARMFRAPINLQAVDVRGVVSPFKAGADADCQRPVDEIYKYNSNGVQLTYLRGLLLQSVNNTVSGSRDFIYDVAFMCRCLGLHAAISTLNASTLTAVDANASTLNASTLTANNNVSADGAGASTLTATSVSADGAGAINALKLTVGASALNTNTSISTPKYLSTSAPTGISAGQYSLKISEQPVEETFTISRLETAKYYGFSVDGNGRYLLDNHIVTHNSGKTLAAVSIANEFISVYKRMYAAAVTRIGIGRRHYVELDRATPSVFVLGFSGAKGAFIRELLDFPEFGFISLSEHDQLVKLRQSAMSGLPDDMNTLREYTNMIKRRVQNKSKDGFYKFFGYDEFVNRLFMTDKISLTDIETDVNARIRNGEKITLENAINELIASGKIQVNQQLVSMFENSLMICDEIHNTYNKDMKNNRGVSIQYILDKVPSVRFLSMSATPINNSPSEVVELINYLNDTKTQKSDMFANPRTLRDDALDKISKLTFGKVSFLQKVDLKYYPKREFVGKYVRVPVSVAGLQAGDEIPYIKFTECPMSEFHQHSYMDHVARENPANPSEYFTIPTDGYSIYDIAFPNPASDTVGLFRSSDTKNKIQNALSEWRDSKLVYVKKIPSGVSLAGGFLRAENISTYSTKYRKMLDILNEIILSSAGNPDRVSKVMIYHNRVRMSGVLLIQEILRENGYLDEGTEPTDGTVCCVCGKRKIDHEPAVDSTTGNTAALAAGNTTGSTSNNTNATPAASVYGHKFVPSRFIMVHSDIDRTTMEQSITKYNAPDNIHGMRYQILVGSKIMKESYNIKDTQHMILLSMPSDIPTFIQVIGRCVRTNSHSRLPQDQRKVDIHILVSVINSSYPHNSLISPELYRYIDKLNIYRVIQQIEREINKTTIDADIHRDIIMSPELMKQYFPNGSTVPVDTLGNLYFEPAYKLPVIKAQDLNLSTFTAYKHYNTEIRTIVYIIKRLFMREPVYTYDELFAAVKKPPIGVEANPALFSEGNFVIALNHLVTPSTQIISDEKVSRTESYFMERLFDQNEKYIYMSRIKHQIVPVGGYYILFPVTETNGRDRVNVDVETYLRTNVQLVGISIPVRDFVKHSKENVNYNVLRAQFVEKYIHADECTMFTLLTEYSADFQQAILQEIITAPEPALADLYKKIIHLYDKFKVLIYVSDIERYKDVVKHFKNGTLPTVSTPIGYISAKSVKIYRQTEGWFEVSKTTLNRQVNYKENDTIVGYLENAPDHMKFKLRKPIQYIREDIRRDIMEKQSKSGEYTSKTRSRAITGDTRLVERGIVCSTKNKHELLRILANLGVSVSKLDRKQVRIKKLCWLIKMRLLENEIKERQRDTKNKWLYSWFDQIPNLV